MNIAQRMKKSSNGNQLDPYVVDALATPPDRYRNGKHQIVFFRDGSALFSEHDHVLFAGNPVDMSEFKKNDTSNYQLFINYLTMLYANKLIGLEWVCKTNHEFTS